MEVEVEEMELCLCPLRMTPVIKGSIWGTPSAALRDLTHSLESTSMSDVR